MVLKVSTSILLYSTLFIALFEPRDIGYALSDSSWVNAMHEELENFERNQDWTLVREHGPQGQHIYPWHSGPGLLASAHGSKDFIKRRPLATGSTAWIKPSESLSRPFITNPMVEVAGSGHGRRGLALTAALHGRAR
jgi:hypothetical protein